MMNQKTLARLLNVVLVLLAVLDLAGLAYLAYRWRQPLSPILKLPTFQPTSAAKIFVPVADLSQVTPAPAIELTPVAAAASPTSTQTSITPPLCEGPQVMTILTMGIDTRKDSYRYGLADAIRIVRVDFVQPKVSLVSLPRDIWVRIPEISDHYGITHGKLNQAYFYGSPGMGYFDGPGQGGGLMALTLAENFGIYVDHYVVINMVTLTRMVDAVDGIDITLARELGKEDGEAYYEAGPHHFNGEEALEFVRLRSTDNDLGRINRQTQVLYALQAKILQPAMLLRLPDLVTAFVDSVVTDLGPQDLAALTCLAPLINPERMLAANLPAEIMTVAHPEDPSIGKNVWAWEVNNKAMRQLMADFQSGEWPKK